MRISHVVASLIAFATASLTACHDTVDTSRIPYAPVYVDLSTQGIWDTYGVHGFSQGRTFINTGTSADKQPTNFQYSTLSYTGYGGLLLVADLENLPLVYDLACPVERKRTVRVTYDRDTQLATCPKCGSEFNVCEHNGSPVSGEAFTRKWGLTRYTARPTSTGGYILQN